MVNKSVVHKSIITIIYLFKTIIWYVHFCQFWMYVICIEPIIFSITVLYLLYAELLFPILTEI